METSSFVKICIMVAGFGISRGARADDVPTPPTPAPPPVSEKKPEQHIMMDHSKADPKAMSRMKDKTVPIHKHGQPMPDPANRPCEEHIMMDHSKADPKAMSRMKDKTFPIHKSGDCTPTTSTPSVTPP